MSELYDGREQSLAKHEILRRYLEPMAHKVLSGWHSLDFIDCFSGPWDNNDTDRLTDTSIGISLATLSAIAKDRIASGKPCSIRCIYNERKRASFGKLARFVDEYGGQFPHVEIVIFKGSFAENAEAIHRAATHKFRLLFVDPTGYSGFPPGVLKLFGGRSSELIVNFMRSFIQRHTSSAHPDAKKHLTELVGPARASFLLETGTSIEAVEREYCAMLRADLGFRYACMSPIHDADKDAIQFNLAYATHHPEGLETMRNAEFKALSDHDQTRFKKRHKVSGGDLFEGHGLEVYGPYATARSSHLSQSPGLLIRELEAAGGKLPFDQLSALLQQTLYLRRTEIGGEIAKLAAEGRIRPVWKERGGRRPKGQETIELVSP